MPAVCLIRARGIERVEEGVLVVSIDRLTPVLQSAIRRLGWSGAEERAHTARPPAVGSVWDERPAELEQIATPDGAL